MLVKGCVWIKGKGLIKFDKIDRKDLSVWFIENHEKIVFLKVDTGLTIWLFDWLNGWMSGAKWKYVPNRPDLWKVKPKMKPCIHGENPFRFING